MKGLFLFTTLAVIAALHADPLALADRFGHTVRVEVTAVTPDTLEYLDNGHRGGNEYKYYIFGLNDAAPGQLIHFTTNCPQVEAYAAQHPDSRPRSSPWQKDRPFPRRHR